MYLLLNLERKGVKGDHISGILKNKDQLLIVFMCYLKSTSEPGVLYSNFIRYCSSPVYRKCAFVV